MDPFSDIESDIGSVPSRLASGPPCRCGQPARLTDGSEAYPGLEHLAHKPFWLCPCGDSFVGCHPGTIKALGTPADKATRKARSATHDVFDPLWRSKKMSRPEAYRRLASALKITAEECHIALFDIPTCLHVQGLVRTGALDRKIQTG